MHRGCSHVRAGVLLSIHEALCQVSVCLNVLQTANSPHQYHLSIALPQSSYRNMFQLVKPHSRLLRVRLQTYSSDCNTGTLGIPLDWSCSVSKSSVNPSAEWQDQRVPIITESRATAVIRMWYKHNSNKCSQPKDLEEVFGFVSFFLDSCAGVSIVFNSEH